MCTYFTWQYPVPQKKIKAGDTQVPSAECPQEVPYPSQWPAEICCFQPPIPSWHRRNTLPLNFRRGCLDRDGDVCMPGHKKKAFCGAIYYSNRPWQQLDSMVIMNNQAPKEEMRAFPLPGPAARRSRWSQLRHGLQYFSQGRWSTAAFLGAREEPRSQKPGSEFF